MIQFDSYFSDGLKPPTRKALCFFFCCEILGAARFISGIPFVFVADFGWSYRVDSWDVLLVRIGSLNGLYYIPLNNINSCFWFP